jgi:hypothetical protein
MADWILVPCLVTLRDEFNRLSPQRAKASDGSIGDTTHSASSSDHNPDESGRTPYEDTDSTNEVHAIDVDSDLRKPGWTMQRCVDIIVGRHRSGKDDRLQNVIFNRRIASRSWGWTWRAYTGASAHTEHAHFSSRYTTAQERDTGSWGLLEDDDVTKSEFTAWMTEWARSDAGKTALARAVLTPDGTVPNPASDSATNPTVAASWALNRAIISATLGYQIRDRVDNVTAVLNTLLHSIGTPAAKALAHQVSPTTATDSTTSGAAGAGSSGAGVGASGAGASGAGASGAGAGVGASGAGTLGAGASGAGASGAGLAGLGAGLSAEETAQALRAALGDEQAADVGRLLAK